MDEKRKYEFNWGLIGDIDAGRPNLGHTTRLEVYRLMQFTFRDVLEQKVGTAETERIFYEAGHLAGQHFYTQIIGPVDNLDAFLKQVQVALREMNIGILRIEKSDPEKGQFVITVGEDLDCSGLPELDYEICTYDEGFIGGLLESFTGKKFHVKEVDCWCTGDRTCRFKADVVE